jgi:hypothetical protein
MAEGEMTPQQKLTYSITVKNMIKQQVSQYGIPLMADFLMDAQVFDEEKNQASIDSIKKNIEDVKANTSISDSKKEKELARLNERLSAYQRFNITRDQMIQNLREVSKDTTAFDYFTASMISSPDSVLALIGLNVKNQLEGARIKNLQLEQEAAKVFEEYAASTNASRDNPAEFNRGLYETIRIPKRGRNNKILRKDGKIVYEDRVSYVQKYNMSNFFIARAKMPARIELSENPTRYEQEAYDNRQAERRKWFKENTQPKPASDIQQIMNAKQRELQAGVITQDEYNKWLKTVEYIDTSTQRTFYMGELTEPSDKYLNPAWLELYNIDGTPKNAKGKYHKWLTDVYLSQQEGLPEGQKPGLLLPSVEKSNGERMMDNAGRAIKTRIQEMGKIKSYDTRYGAPAIAGTSAKYIPVYYTQSMKPEDVSLNLMGSTMMFGGMANNFKALNDIYSEIMLLQKIVGERVVAETNAKGEALMNPIASKLGLERFMHKNGETFSAKRLNDFIDMVVHGEMEAREEILGLSASKLTNSLMGYSAITSIAADLIKGVSNNLQGNIQVLIEAASSEFFSIKDFMKGKSYYMKSVPGFISDFGKFTSESLGGKLYDQYDPIQGNFMDQYGRMVTGSVANKLFRVDTLFWNQHFGEHEIQVSTLFALLNATRVKDSESDQEISLLEAYEKYGVEDIYAKTDFTDKKRINLQNRLHALNKRLHGIYNDIDKSVAQKYSLGRLGFMYRKYLIPAYTRRFKKLGYDQELGAETEGYYRTFWDLYLKNLVTFQTSLIKKWGDMTPFEKAQVKRTLAEASILLSLVGLVIALTALAGDDDDDELKKSWGYNFMLYQATRMRSETAQYVPILGIRDIYRVMKSPSAATTSIDRMIKFVDQFLIQSWDPEKASYQRRTGIWEKGDNKSWAFFLRLMGLSGYTLHPEEALKGFEASLAK